MHIEQTYQSIMEKLKKGERALFQMEAELEEELRIELRKLCALNSFGPEETQRYNKALCLLTHQTKGNGEFGSDILAIVASVDNLSNESVIYSMTAISKHVIEFCQLRGIKYPSTLFEMFRKYLQTKDAEVLEWTLRTIDQIGMKSIALKNDILKVRPHFFKGLNPHHKNSRAIIEMLEKRWGVFSG